MIDKDFVEEYDELINHLLHKNSNVKHWEVEDYKILVYTRLLENPSYDAERGPFTTWLGWVVKSVVSNEIKKRSRSSDALDHSVDLDMANNVIGTEDAGTAEDELTRIFKAAQLSPRDEGIVKDIYLEDRTYQEAADRAGMDLEAVKKVVYRAMKVLRHEAVG